MSDFALDWLKLRESADLAARDPGLARRFAAALRREPGQPLRLVDLGAGSGANCRALAPRIGGDQDWSLVERDPLLIAAQESAFTVWARHQGYPVQAGGGRILVKPPGATWQIAATALDLARDLDLIARRHPHGIAAAAFFDLVSVAWTEHLVDWLARCRLPLLAALTVDGRRLWLPAAPEDAIVGAAFRRHQKSDKGFGPALGGDAADFLAAACAAKGFSIFEMRSDWRLDAAASDLLVELVIGEAEAARKAAPEQVGPIAAWEARRRDEARSGALSLTIGHRDLLALPAQS
jgi:hypothetical protein